MFYSQLSSRCLLDKFGISHVFKQRLTELGQVYFNCEMPTWLRKALNGGLLTPLVKKPAPEGETPDARPTNARDIDVSIWLKPYSARRTLLLAQYWSPSS